MACVSAACAGRVTIFSTGGRILRSYTLTLAARFYALLVYKSNPESLNLISLSGNEIQH